MKAWWFAPQNGRLGYGDGREPAPGVTHSIRDDQTPELCAVGMHGSTRVLDALTYVYHSPVTLWRVEISDDVQIGDVKICGRSRTYLWSVDVSDDLLRRFARQCALDVIDLWLAPDVVVRYLKTGDESIRSAAESAAWSAAESAAWSAAESAAGAAARAAAESAAWWAAESAAWSAAGSAACSAARVAAGSAANRRLTAMVSRLPRVIA